MQLSIPTSRLGLGRAVKRAVHARAGFLSDAASQTATAAGLLGVSLSTLYLLRDVGRFEAGELQARPALPGVDAEEEDEQGFIFSISTVLSLIPFLSWLVRSPCATAWYVGHDLHTTTVATPSACLTSHQLRDRKYGLCAATELLPDTTKALPGSLATHAGMGVPGPQHPQPTAALRLRGRLRAPGAVPGRVSQLVVLYNICPRRPPFPGVQLCTTDQNCRERTTSSALLLSKV